MNTKLNDALSGSAGLYTTVDPEPDPRRRQPYLVDHSDVAGRSHIMWGAVCLLPTVYLKHARPHRLTPPMTEREFSSLKDSIRHHKAVLQPIMLLSDGTVLDGTHRLKAICELLVSESLTVQMPPPLFVLPVNEAAERALVVMLNATRRMMTNEQKRQMVRDLLLAGHDGTDQLIASLVMLDDETVRDIRLELESTGQLAIIASRRDRRGRHHARRTLKANTPSRPRESRARTEARARRGMHEVVAETHSTAPTLDLVIHDLDPQRAAAVRHWLPRILPAWWEAIGYFPITARRLLALDRRALAIENDAAAMPAIGLVIKAATGQEISGFRITTHREGGIASTYYVLSPAGWSKHGPRE